MTALTVGLVSGAAPLRAQEPTRLCARFGEVVETGAIAAAELLETSGLVSSREHGGVLYAHNDAGGGTVVFALDETGVDLGPYDVLGAEPGDWEDIAIGPMPRGGRSAIYIGDIGDNQVRRSTVTVLRVVEPDLRPDGGGGQLGPAEVLQFAYPDGAVDAEALVVDPRSGDLVIVASPASGAARIYSASAADLVAGATIELVDEGVVVGADGAAVTAADVSPDGSILLLRTTEAVLAFERGDEPIGQTLTSTPCRAPTPDEPAPQAIAFVSDGSAYITASEVAGAINQGELPPGSASRLYRVSIAEPGEVAPTTSTTTPESTTTATDTTTTAAPPTTTSPGTASPTTAPGSPDTSSAGTEAPEGTDPVATNPGDVSPDDGDPDQVDTPGPGGGETSEDGGGLPVWVIAVVVAAIAAAVVAFVVVRRRRNEPLPGSAPLGTDPFAPPTVAPPAVPPPDLPPPDLPPPDPGGRLG